MKSAYYTAVVTNAYRMAIDSYYADKENYKFNPLWMRELESVSHREYCTGFYFEYPIENAQLTSNTGYIREKAYFAMACEMDEQEKAVQEQLNKNCDDGKFYLFMQKNKCKIGDSAEIISPSAVGRTLDITDLRDSKGETIESAPHPFMHFFVKVPFDVKVGDILRAGE
jgi:putative protease